MVDDESMKDFVTKVHVLADSLFASVSSDLLHDQDFICFVLDGLGPNFQYFISSIHSQPNMMFDGFIHLIIQEDNFLKRQTTLSAIFSSPSVFGANSK